MRHAIADRALMGIVISYLIHKHAIHVETDDQPLNVRGTH